MKLNKSCCETCIHQSICILKSDYKDLYEKISSFKENNNFSFNLGCIYYKKEKDWSER